MASSPKRIAELSPEAGQDLIAIYEYTTHAWGVQQAEDYAAYLHAVALKLAAAEIKGRALETFPGVQSFTARWPQSRYGHCLIYQETPKGTLVLRLLHTAMDIPSHLKQP